MPGQKREPPSADAGEDWLSLFSEHDRRRRSCRLPLVADPKSPQFPGAVEFRRHQLFRKRCADPWSPDGGMAVPNTVLYFSAYEEIVWRLRNLSSQHDQQSWLHPLAAGASARLVSSTVTAPFEFLRTRQAAATGEGITKNIGLWQEFRSIVQNEGAATLYKGLHPTLWRDVPFSAIYWLSVEQCRTLWNRVYPHHTRAEMLRKEVSWIAQSSQWLQELSPGSS